MEMSIDSISGYTQVKTTQFTSTEINSSNKVSLHPVSKQNNNVDDTKAHTSLEGTSTLIQFFWLHPPIEN